MGGGGGAEWGGGEARWKRKIKETIDLWLQYKYAFKYLFY